jgi:hypothetical protein
VGGGGGGLKSATERDANAVQVNERSYCFVCKWLEEYNILVHVCVAIVHGGEHQGSCGWNHRVHVEQSSLLHYDAVCLARGSSSH